MSYETVQWNGFVIKPKQDFPRGSKDSGFVVTKDGCNIMPGATWFRSLDQARKGIAAYVLAQKISPEDTGDAFWMLMELSNPTERSPQ